MIKTLFRKLALFAVALAVATPALTALAQKSRNAPAAASAKKPALESSKKVKYKDKTTVDFDEANIDGTVKNPFGSIVNSRDQDFDKGFIKLRYHWHDQMVMSLSGLSGN